MYSVGCVGQESGCPSQGLKLVCVCYIVYIIPVDNHKVAACVDTTSKAATNIQ